MRRVVAGAFGVLGRLLFAGERHRLAEVAREIDTPARCGCVGVLERLAGPLMQQEPAFGLDRLVHRVAGQHVREQVPVDIAEVFDEEAHGEALLESVEHDLARHVAHAREQIDGDVTTEDRGRVEDFAALIGQPVEPAVDQRAYAGRRDRRERFGEPTVAVELGRLLVELAQELTEVVRIPAGDVAAARPRRR